MSLMLTVWFKGLGVNDYIYTERMGIPCIEYTGKHHARITKELTSDEFDSFVEFKTMQHNQAQVFLMNITKKAEE